MQLRVDELIDQLKSIERSMPGAATRNPRLSVINTIKFLQPNAGRILSDLVEELAAKKRKTAAKTRRAATALRTDVVEKYIANLNSVGVNQVAFSSVHERMQRDKQIRIVELKEILRRYTGDTSALKSKKVGFDKIEQTFDTRWKLANR